MTPDHPSTQTTTSDSLGASASPSEDSTIQTISAKQDESTVTTDNPTTQTPNSSTQDESRMTTNDPTTQTATSVSQEARTDQLNVTTNFTILELTSALSLSTAVFLNKTEGNVSASASYSRHSYVLIIVCLYAKLTV